MIKELGGVCFLLVTLEKSSYFSPLVPSSPSDTTLRVKFVLRVFIKLNSLNKVSQTSIS